MPKYTLGIGKLLGKNPVKHSICNINILDVYVSLYLSDVGITVWIKKLQSLVQLILYPDTQADLVIEIYADYKIK